MTKYYLLITSLLFNLGSFASANNIAEKRLIEQVKQLKAAYKGSPYKNQYKKNQLKYLNNFPKNAEQFYFFFSDSSKSPLYKKTQYILKLEQLVTEHPHKTMCLVTQLASDMELTNASSKKLQLVFMKIATSYSNLFAQAFKKLALKKQDNLLHFLASGEKGPATGYTSLQYILKRTNHSIIAEKMEQTLKIWN